MSSESNPKLQRLLRADDALRRHDVATFVAFYVPDL